MPFLVCFIVGIYLFILRICYCTLIDYIQMLCLCQCNLNFEAEDAIFVIFFSVCSFICTSVFSIFSCFIAAFYLLFSSVNVGATVEHCAAKSERCFAFRRRGSQICDEILMLFFPLKLLLSKYVFCT